MPSCVGWTKRFEIDSRSIRAIRGRSLERLRRLGYSKGMKTILTPIDFSGVTEAVVDQTLELAKNLKARVVLLSVMQPPVITSEYAPYLENIGEIVAAGEKASTRHLTRWRERLTKGGIKVDILQFTGAPASFILQQAQKLKADYIVMGSHGHTAFYELLVGSTTHGVLLKAPCPVVVVPGRKKKKR